jgi:hypothetical protein
MFRNGNLHAVTNAKSVLSTQFVISKHKRDCEAGWRHMKMHDWRLHVKVLNDLRGP